MPRLAVVCRGAYGDRCIRALRFLLRQGGSDELVAPPAVAAALCDAAWRICGDPPPRREANSMASRPGGPCRGVGPACPDHAGHARPRYQERPDLHSGDHRRRRAWLISGRLHHSPFALPGGRDRRRGRLCHRAGGVLRPLAPGQGTSRDGHPRLRATPDALALSDARCAGAAHESHDHAVQHVGTLDLGIRRPGAHAPAVALHGGGGLQSPPGHRIGALAVLRIVAMGEDQLGELDARVDTAHSSEGALRVALQGRPAGATSPPRRDRRPARAARRHDECRAMRAGLPFA